MKSPTCTIFLMALIFIAACGESPEENARQFSEIKTELIDNYHHKRELFDKIKVYWKLNHIKFIEFSTDTLINISFKTGSITDTVELQELENVGIKSAAVKDILSLDSLNANDLPELKKDLEMINANSIWLIDYYDAIRGKYIKELDLRYTQSMNGLHFFYRIFQEPLDSMKGRSYDILIQDNKTGGKLSADAVWYYK